MSINKKILNKNKQINIKWYKIINKQFKVWKNIFLWKNKNIKKT